MLDQSGHSPNPGDRVPQNLSTPQNTPPGFASFPPDVWSLGATPTHLGKFKIEGDWPTTGQLEQIINERYRQSSFRLFHDLREGANQVLAQIKFVGFSLQMVGEQAPLLNDQGQTLGDVIAALKVLPKMLRELPHDGLMYKILVEEIKQTERILEKLRDVQHLNLGATLQDLDQRTGVLSLCFKEFLTYEPRKYSLFSLSPSGHPLSLHYDRLAELAGNPKAWVFDIDDCVIQSEEAQRKAWGIALEKWVAQTQSLANQDDVIQKLRSTAEYCLHNDCSDKMLGLLRAICDEQGLKIPNPLGDSPKVALEKALVPYRSRVMLDFLKDGEVTFTKGALDIIVQSHLSGKRLGFCTNTCQAISEPLLREVFRSAGLPYDFDTLFPSHGRVYGDTTPARKPSPLMWLVAAHRLGVRPSEAIIFDNSLNNCVVASDLSGFGGSQLLSMHYGDLELLRPQEQFAAVVGLTNGSVARLNDWHAWTREECRPIKAVLAGLDSVVTK